MILDYRRITIKNDVATVTFRKTVGPTRAGELLSESSSIELVDQVGHFSGTPAQPAPPLNSPGN